jgi:hypothetical protein
MPGKQQIENSEEPGFIIGTPKKYAQRSTIQHWYISFNGGNFGI